MERWRGWIAAAGVGVAVFLLGWANLEFSRQVGRIAAVWTPNAVVLAAMLRARPGHWWRYLASAYIGNIAANFAIGDALSIGFSTAFWNSLEIVICAGLIRGLIRDRVDLSRSRDLLLFLVIGGVVGPGVSAVCTALTLVLLHKAGFVISLLDWWSPDALGILTVTPALLALSGEALGELGRKIRQERRGLSLIVLAVSLAVVFGQNRYPLLFMAPPALIMVAFELDLAGAALALLITAVVAVAMTSTGHGPAMLIRSDFSTRLALTQVFLVTMTISVLPVASALSRRGRLEAELREANRFSTLAEEIAGVGYWRRDFRAGRSLWSSETYRLFGLPRDFDLSSGAEIGLFTPEDQLRVVETVQRARINGESYELKARLRRADDGRERIVAFKGEVERSGPGPAEAIFGVMRDLTDEETRRSQLEESEQRYRIIAENATDVISRASRSGRFTYLSPSVTKVLGYQPDELVGRDPMHIIHPDDAEILTSHWARIIGPDPVERATIQFRGRHKDGRWIWLEANPTLVRLADGAPSEVVDVIRDVTARVSLEAEILAARDAALAAATAKTEFLANMSHEIRTPLTGVIGFSQLLHGEPLTDNARRYAQRILTAGEALLAVVNDILDFSKLEAAQIELDPHGFDPLADIRETLELMSEQAAGKGLSLAMSSDGDVPAFVFADSARLRQVVLNLLANAIKFTNAGGVAVRVGYDRAGPGRLRVEVSDTGVGVPEALRHRLFRRFSQVDGSISREHGGTGLGLAICKSLVELMGGEIDVDSRAGEGSTFWFTITAPQAAAAAPLETIGAGETDQAPARILIVDDTDANRDLVRTMLQALGHDCREATGGAEAVALATQDRFDLILMDMQMPGMDGVAATRAIRQTAAPNRDTPILALTANVLPAQIGLCLEAGMNDHIAKPVSPRDLIVKVSLWIEVVRSAAAEPRGEAAG